MTLEQYKKQFDRQHAMWERKMAPVFYNALKAQMAPVLVLRNFENAEAFILPDAIAQAFTTCYTECGLYFAKGEWKRISKEETKADADIMIQFMSQRWLQLLREIALISAFDTILDITDYTKERLRFALAEALEKGYGADETARLIEQYTLKGFGLRRAMVIARTETTYAANEGKRISANDWAESVGIKLYKKWIVRNDGREREAHRIAGADKAILENKLFLVGGEKLIQPGDIRASAANRVNCRCTTIYVSERKARQLYGV
jgi:hypothetical protein